MDVRIYNWNLLSTRLASPSYHVHCKPEHLNTNTRCQIVEQRLESEIKQQAIICLQELSEEWLSILVPFLDTENYTFLYDSQWLGAGIAFPRSKYKLRAFVLKNVGEELGKKCVMRVPTRFENLISFTGSTFRWLWNKLPYYTKFPPNTDVWQIATKRNNRFVGVTLYSEENCRFFNIYVYHMPCEFKHNDVMNIHAAGLLSGIQAHSGELPYILAGDFNSTPDSSVYNLITKGIIPTFPLSKVYSKLPSLKDRYYAPLTSAYAFVQGKEPKFTNFGWSKDAPKAFKDTIDYIFSSSGFIPIRVMPTDVDLKAGTESLPNEEEPSDHLPLRATFSFVEN